MMPNRIQSENINCQAFGLSDRENQGFVLWSTTALHAQATPTTLLRKRDLCFFSQTKLFWISTQNLPVS